MKTKIAASLSVLLIAVVYFVSGHRSTFNRPTDFRDAPSALDSLRETGDVQKDSNIPTPTPAATISRGSSSDAIFKSAAPSVGEGLREGEFPLSQQVKRSSTAVEISKISTEPPYIKMMDFHAFGGTVKPELDGMVTDKSWNTMGITNVTGPDSKLLCRAFMTCYNGKKISCWAIGEECSVGYKAGYTAPELPQEWSYGGIRCSAWAGKSDEKAIKKEASCHD